jgi:hypothetical protein
VGALVSSEDFIRLTIEHIEKMEIKYSFLLNIRVVDNKSKAREQVQTQRMANKFS